MPALVYGAGEAAHAATTTSLVVVGTTWLVGMVGHFVWLLVAVAAYTAAQSLVVL